MSGQVHAPAAVPLEKLWRVDGIQIWSGGSGEEEVLLSLSGTFQSVAKWNIALVMDEIAGMIRTGETQSVRRKTCPRVTFITTNFTWIGLELNPRHPRWQVGV